MTTYTDQIQKLLQQRAQLERTLNRHNERYAAAMEKHGLTEEVAQLWADRCKVARKTQRS